MGAFHDRLRMLMHSRRLTNNQLGAMVNMSGSAISRYLNSDRVPNAEIIADISRKMGVSTDYLLGLSNRESEDDMTFDELMQVVRINAKRFSSTERAMLMHTLSTINYIM